MSTKLRGSIIFNNMDPDKWKKLKQSGAFKRKVRKTFESLKTGPSTSVNSVPQQTGGQEQMMGTENGSVYILY